MLIQQIVCLSFPSNQTDYIGRQYPSGDQLQGQPMGTHPATPLLSPETLVQWRVALEDEWAWEEPQKAGREAEEIVVFTGETTAHKPPYQNCKKNKHNQNTTLS